MSYGINKKDNGYARLVADIDAPKTVWMALAVSFADKLTGQTGVGLEAVGDAIFKEWEVLHQNGIVPQKPRRS